MNLTIVPKKLRGTVTPPPSKSQAHRLIIAAALAEGTSTIENVAFSQDVEATLRCMEALGASWSETSPGTVRIVGTGGRRTPGGALPQLDCGESGSTLRFLIRIRCSVRFLSRHFKDSSSVSGSDHSSISRKVSCLDLRLSRLPFCLSCSHLFIRYIEFKLKFRYINFDNISLFYECNRTSYSRLRRHMADRGAA